MWGLVYVDVLALRLLCCFGVNREGGIYKRAQKKEEGIETGLRDGDDPLREIRWLREDG